MVTYEILSEGVKYVATGLLGVLWWDVRKVRQLKDSIMGDIERKYLTKDKHVDLCLIKEAETENKVLKAIYDTKTEIIKEIQKSNGA
uniref:Uncharacterized protein n=1 Tax=viral metagenome TaxID=1070528 RepID=A0A6M3J009_9ZZZZ